MQTFISMALCQHCVWETGPTMLTGYCLSHHTGDKCKRATDCALVRVDASIH